MDAPLEHVTDPEPLAALRARARTIQLQAAAAAVLLTAAICLLP